MGHLIKNQLAAAGLLSHPITGPTMPKPLPLAHPGPSPTANTSPVSRVTSVSRGPVKECRPPACYPSAGALCWPPSMLVLRDRVTCHRLRGGGGVGGVESRFRGHWLWNQREFMQLLSIAALRAHFKHPHLEKLTAVPSSAHPPHPPPHQTGGRSRLYLDTARGDRGVPDAALGFPLGCARRV